MPGPDRLIVVAGTGTEVGKTWAAARLVRAWRDAGLTVAVRKPVQSFSPGEETDADVLAAASGVQPADVCPPHRWFDVPMAPPMAAEKLGRPAFTVADLVDDLQWPEDVAVGLVESAGGVRSPIAGDGDTTDLARSLHADGVVLVADAGLGTISDVRLAMSALAPLPVLVLLNHYDGGNDLHARNRQWLTDRDGFDIETDLTATVARGFGWCRPS